MQLPNIHEPTFMTVIVVVIVLFVLYHFVIRKR